MKVLAIATLLCAATAGFAADYEPTEGWPYLFDDFEPATVYYRNSAPAHANINIHLFNNTLHFIDGEDIKAASNALYIDSVVCDNNTVLEHKGKYYVERLYATPHVLVGRTCEADFSSMNKGSGAYGMGTSVSATQNVAAFDDYGNVAARKYNETKADRYNSSTLPTITRFTIVTDEDICHATKRGVNGILSKEERKAFNAFLKENKIKWKEAESLQKVADFLEGIITKRNTSE